MALCRYCMHAVLSDGMACSQCLAAKDLRDPAGLAKLGQIQLEVIFEDASHPLASQAMHLWQQREVYGAGMPSTSATCCGPLHRTCTGSGRRVDSSPKPPPVRSAGAAVYCPACGAQFGGMQQCPWDGHVLLPLAGADPTAVAFYAVLRALEA